MTDKGFNNAAMVEKIDIDKEFWEKKIIEKL